MSDLVGNPEDRFSQNEAHMENIKITFFLLSVPNIVFYEDGKLTKLSLPSYLSTEKAYMYVAGYLLTQLIMALAICDGNP